MQYTTKMHQFLITFPALVQFSTRKEDRNLISGIMSVHKGVECAGLSNRYINFKMEGNTIQPKFRHEATKMCWLLSVPKINTKI